MLGLNGQPSEFDVFSFFLARELGRTVAELDTMSMDERTKWSAYYEAKTAIEGMRPVAGMPQGAAS